MPTRLPPVRADVAALLLSAGVCACGGRPTDESGFDEACGTIALAPAQLSLLQIERSERADFHCLVSLRARVPLRHASFQWIEYDDHGLELDRDLALVWHVKAGDTLRVVVQMRSGVHQIRAADLMEHE